MNAEPTTMNAAFTFHAMTMTRASSKMIHDPTPENAVTPSMMVTDSMSARDDAFTPSRKPLASGDLRSLGMNGLLRGTRTNDGKKMAMVATVAPGRPRIR